MIEKVPVNFKFIFGNNRKLRHLMKQWKTHHKYKTFVITGPTGVGKTLLLKQLAHEVEKSAYITGETLLSHIYENVREGNHQIKLPVEPDAEVIMIDMLEGIQGKKSLTELIADILYREKYSVANVKRLILVTIENKKLAEEFANITGYQVVQIKHTKPNKRIVEECEKVMGITILDKCDINEIDNMFMLMQAFNRFK